MDSSSSSGRSLTSFGPASSDPAVARPSDTSVPVDDDALFTPTALDFAYRAFLARDAVKTSVPSVFASAQAVDSASFAGRGATFSVYRRRIPRQKPIKRTVRLDGFTVEMEDDRKLPDVVAYKVAMIDFSDKGEAATDVSRRAVNAAVMELYLSAHRPILRHANLVDFLGLAWGANPFDMSQRLPVLVVEFAEFGSLSDLQQRECLGLEARRKLCLDVCQGLHMLHSCGVVHGDMKADNVLVFPDKEHRYIAKLSDFGYSTVMGTSRDVLHLGGTRPWKAPEAKAAVKVSDAKYTDVYSLALLIWCTFAHGQNIFRILIDPAKHGEEYYAEAERMKEAGELAAHAAHISHWYLKALESASCGDPRQLASNLASLQERLERMHTQTETEDPAALIGHVEDVLCAIPTAHFSMLEALHPQIVETVQRCGLYDAMQQAVAIGLSDEPGQRALDRIMAALGHSGEFPQEMSGSDMVLTSNLNVSHDADTSPPATPGTSSLILLGVQQHKFTWHNWPSMDPSVQKYLTRIYIQRGQTEAARNMINPPEAFLLTSLYINGYGVDRDLEQASRWLSAAWRAEHPLATAYGYRIARAIGMPLQDLGGVAESLKLMAMRGSRVALEDLASVSESQYEGMKKSIRNALAGVGAGFFFEQAMLHGFGYGSWMKTFGNIPILLQNFSRLSRIADYTVNKRGDRILHMAASCGQTEAIEALLDRFTALQVDQLNDQGETPLLCACRAGQTGTVLWLTSHGATASGAARNGESTLHWLVSFDDEDVKTVGAALMEAGAEVDAKTASAIAHHADFPTSLIPDRLPEGYPIAWGEFLHGVSFLMRDVRYLANGAADLRHVDTATHCDRPQVVKFLLSSMPDPLICSTSWPRANSALETAASQSRPECLKLMMRAMEAFNIQQEAPNHRGITISGLLYQAVMGSSLFDMILYNGPGYDQAMKQTLDFLLPRANRVAAGNGYGGFNQTLLYLAVSLARDQVVEYLLNHGTDAMKAGPDYDEHILRSQDVGGFKKTDIDRACGVDMRTPLLEAVRWNRPKLVDLLIEHGADARRGCKNPFSGKESTWNALHVLAHSGQDDIRLIRRLVAHGASVDGSSEHSDGTESPLLVAVQSDSFQVADELVNLGADPNAITLGSGHLTLTHPATILGHVVASNARNSIARIRYVFSSMSAHRRVDMIVEPERRWTALHRAAAAHIDASFRGTDATEPAPLQWADVDWPANREILNELLGKFSSQDDLDAVETSAGLTALHLAAIAGNDAAISLLLDRGARADILSGGGDGKTAGVMALGMQKHSQGIQRSRHEVAARNRCVQLLNAGTVQSAA
ncbi:hypothetical protein GMORB2_6569 [Geosmithia morbida]|uniref:Protein kinase domain-containing protein n=1 Tax=Geosmithia morbida TaxID=1094350 RepID=A0A9P4YTW5_9HYPO|nr:uncharacterized protein GMORB2_6569 [Geosmithia morbida]KAF4123021.1 hypothetical protein GMORB2_6569 [Geosmithia morbida]